MVFQFGGDVTLSVFKGLATVIIGRNLASVGMGNLYKISKYRGKTHLQAGNSRSGDFSGLVASQPLFTTLTSGAQFIHFRIKTWPDHRALSHKRGGIIRQGFGEQS